ncbi:MAG: tail fiber domain-containing protein, partial [Bacteroidia bacterium]|nr:tail fiber domain-containing protein [Bacteroidia bacterium]
QNTFAQYGIYAYANTAPTVGNTWNDDLESDLGWTYSGSGTYTSTRNVIASDCAGGSCITGSPNSGTNVVNLKVCAISSTAYISKTFTIASGGGTWTFWYKIGSESDWDFLQYSTNGGTSYTNIVSGCVDTWTLASIALSAGTQTLRIRFYCDNSNNLLGSKTIIDDIKITNVASTGTTYAGYFNGNICWTGTSGACSDKRYKKDVVTIDGALNKVISLNGIYYYWRKDEFPSMNFSNKKQIGVIAQDVEPLFPELIATDANGYKTADYSKITPILIEAIKELQKQIDSLKSENQLLKNDVESIKSQLGIINIRDDNKNKNIKVKKIQTAEVKESVNYEENNQQNNNSGIIEDIPRAIP